MIDLQDLRERPDAYADAAKKKRINVDVKNFLKVDQGRRELTLAVDDMRAKRNAVSKQIPTMKGAEKEAAVKEFMEQYNNQAGHIFKGFKANIKHYLKI